MSIRIINPQTGKETGAMLNSKNELIGAVCGCNGKYTKASDCNKFIFDEKTRKLSCPECGKEIEVIKTPQQIQKEKEDEIAKRNAEKLKNLQLVLVGSDWECGFKYYTLSAQIEHDDWLKVKEYFKYYNPGWSRGQELEFDGFEPTGWLTQKPEAVEKILIQEGLMKTENTLKAKEEQNRLEKEKQEKIAEEQIKETEQVKNKMDEIQKQLNNAFNTTESRALTDAEASEYYFNADYFKNTVESYAVTETEIIKVLNMGDFKTGVAIPYSEKVEKLIKKAADV